MKRRYPDGPRIHLPLAFIAQMASRWFPIDPLGFGLKVAREFGDIAHYQFGPLHIYQLNHPDLARQVLVEQAEKFHKPKLVKRAFQPFAGEGLITSDGAFWRQQRKLIQPAFHQRRLAAYSEVMMAHALRMADSFGDGEVREMGAEMTKLTLGVVVKTLFGADLPREAGDIGGSMMAVLDAASQRVNALVKIPWWVPTGVICASDARWRSWMRSFKFSSRRSGRRRRETRRSALSAAGGRG